MSRALIVSVLVLTVALVAFADECSFALHSFFLPSQAAGCFGKLPLTANAKAGTLAVLRSMVPMYAFGDISSNSGEPFFIRTDLLKELTRIENTNYVMDYDFHEDLRRTFASLGDAHTTYSAPFAYRQFAALFPWAPYAQIVSGQLSIFAGNVSTIFGQPYPWVDPNVPAVNLADYTNLQIASINLVDAIDYVQSVGDNVGYSRSKSTRFNYAFLVGLPAMTVGRTANLPRFNNWFITFTNGASVTVPVAMTNLYEFEDVQNFSYLVHGLNSVTGEKMSEDHEAHVNNDPMANPRIAHKLGYVNVDHLAEHQARISNGNGRRPGAGSLKFDENLVGTIDNSKSDNEMHTMDVSGLGPLDLEPMFTSLNNTVSCWAWSAQNTIIIRSSALVPPGSFSDAYFGQWFSSQVSTFSQCLGAQISRNYPNIMLDVRSNGGGSELARAFIPMSGSVRVDPGTTQPVTNNSWYEGDVFRSLGGHYSAYTPQGYFPDECNVELSNLPAVTPTFTKLMLFSDGLCGSACSQFNTKLRYHGRSRVVTIGGNLKDVFESSAFTGGNVLDWAPVVSAYGNALGLQNLPTTAATRFNFNAMYAGQQPLWREFTPISGDYQINQWDFKTDPVYTMTGAAYFQYTQASSALQQAAAFFATADYTSSLQPLGPAYLPVPLQDQGVQPPPTVVIGVIAGVLGSAVVILLIITIVLCCRKSGGSSGPSDSTPLSSGYLAQQQ